MSRRARHAGSEFTLLLRQFQSAIAVKGLARCLLVLADWASVRRVADGLPVLPHAVIRAASTIYNNVIFIVSKQKKVRYVFIRCDADTTYRIL